MAVTKERATKMRAAVMRRKLDDYRMTSCQTKLVKALALLGEVSVESKNHPDVIEAVHLVFALERAFRLGARD